MSPASHLDGRLWKPLGIVPGVPRLFQERPAGRRGEPAQALTRCVVVEELEPRLLLSSAAGVAVDPLPVAAPPDSATAEYSILDRATGATYNQSQLFGGSVVDLASLGSSSYVGLTPAQIRHAYGFDLISGDGAGQTIAIVDAYDDPALVDSNLPGYATSDLHYFDAQFGLPDFGGSGPTFQKVGQDGSSTLAPPSGTTGWSAEECLDVEWAHALAPEANIVLVEANSPTNANLIYDVNHVVTSAVDTARHLSGVSVVSMSFATPDENSELSMDTVFATPSGHVGVTFVAATGDTGAPAGYPAYSPYVVAVGGTTLSLSGGNYSGETGWNDSGGGVSGYEPEPVYQQGVVPPGITTTNRAAPDVAFDADPNSGVALYDSYDYGSATPWVQAGGTSLATPCWGGLIAVANQIRVSAGATPLDGYNQTLPILYKLPSADFHDIITGNNGNAAGPGYDLVTGLGSPVANLLVPGLVAGLNTTVPFPTPLNLVNPAGSLVYSGSVSANIATISDTDGYSLNLAAGQTITVLVSPASSLQPTVELQDSAGTVLAAATSAAGGQGVILQTVPVTAAGMYTITIGSSAGTVGLFTLQATLNAAVESEGNGGTSNSTIATAQSIDSSFINLGGSASRGAVVGTSEAGIGLLPAEVEPNDSISLANNASGNFAAYSGNLYQLGIKGSISTSSDVDWFKIGSLVAGDVITISDSGSASDRGTLGNPYVYLYRYDGGSPILMASDAGSGPGNDSLIYRYSVTTADIYYVVAGANTGRHGGRSSTGSYDLGVWLENTGAPPATGGTLTSETEPNDTYSTANDASTSWRPVQYLSQTSGTITSGDLDYYSFQFTSGDLVSINAHSTSSLDARVYLLNGSGTVIALEDGTSNGPSPDSPVYAYQIPTTGTYYVVVAAHSGTGSYSANVYLSTNTPPPVPTPGVDCYRLDLSAGDVVTLGLKTLSAGTLSLALEDAGGDTLAVGATDSSNLDEVISDFSVGSAGAYYAVITGFQATPFSLVVTRQLSFDTEPNNSLASAQPIPILPGSGSAGVLGYAESGGSDYYGVSVSAGDLLTIATATPGDEAYQFVNTLDPKIELYDPSGALVASDDNSAPDGRNALLSYTALAGGTYTVEVLSNNGATGEYVLTASVKQPAASVAARLVFYNNSVLDGNNPAAGTADDNAIDASKQALLPGQTVSDDSVTGYASGLNGIMVDIANLANPAGLTLANVGDYFSFQTLTLANPSAWVTAPAPTAVAVRAGQGVGGSDRVTIIWADNANVGCWLRTTVLAGAAWTGLAADDVFTFGNLPGDADGDGAVDVVDLGVLAKNYDGTGKGVDDGDFSGDGNVDVVDLGILAKDYDLSLPSLAAAGAAPQPMALTVSAQTAQNMAGASSQTVADARSDSLQPLPAGQAQLVAAGEYAPDPPSAQAGLGAASVVPKASGIAQGAGTIARVAPTTEVPPLDLLGLAALPSGSSSVGPVLAERAAAHPAGRSGRELDLLSLDNLGL